MKLLAALSSLIVSSTVNGYCSQSSKPCDDHASCETDDGDEGCMYHNIVPASIFSSAPPKCVLNCVPCAAIDKFESISKFMDGCPDNPEDCLNGDELAHFCDEDDYRRVLSTFDDRRLFALMEGEELEDHSKKHKAKKENTSLGICDHAESKVHGKSASYNECFGLEKPAEEDHGIRTNSDALKPWTTPSDERASLLASDPGIWAIENFFDQEETDKIIELAEKYGNDLKMYGPCTNEKRSANAHPSDKWCFMISTEKVCDGDHQDLHCPIETEKDDDTLVAGILSRFQETWATQIDPVPYVKFHLSKGSTPPVDVHTDAFSVSFLLYLTDGGASTLFPNAELSIKPSKGTAITWLNTNQEGQRNAKADHAVEAHPKNAEDRLVLLLNFKASPATILNEA